MEQTIFEFGEWRSTWFGTYWLAVLIGLGSIVWLLYQRDSSGLPLWVRHSLVTARLLVLLAALLIYLDPRLRVLKTIERPSHVMVLVDQSQSMTIDDRASARDASHSRFDTVRHRLDEGWLTRLRQRQGVSLLGFGRELKSIGEFPKGTEPSAQIDWTKHAAVAEETRLGDLLADALRNENSGPLAGLILFSDGRQTTGGPIEPAIALARSRKCPIHAVATGSEQLPPNVRLTNLQVPARAFPGDRIRIAATLQVMGLASRSVPVAFELAAEANVVRAQVIETKTVVVDDRGGMVPLEFQYVPQTTGAWNVRLSTPADPAEPRTDDNTVAATVEVIDRKTKVLLVASGPSHEYRFLRNLLYRDKTVELSVLLQSATGGIAQEAEKVLRVFPETREALFGQDLVIALDVDWSAMAPPSRDLLVEWVGTQAGGLVLAAGPVGTPRLARDESLDEIQQLFPVGLKEVFTSELDAGSRAEPWGLQFTPEGEAAEYLRLDDDPARSRQLWHDFPGFYWCYPTSGAKPASVVLARFADPRAASPAGAPAVFASQFFGSGRVLYLGSAELWRLRRVEERLYDQLWIRIVRQLAQGRLLRGSGRATLLLATEEVSLGANLPVQAQLLDAEFRPWTANLAPLRVVDPAGKITEIQLTPVPGKPGQFAGMVPARMLGEHRLQLPVPGGGESAERRVTCRAPEREFEDPRVDRALLSRLAIETGGRIWNLTEIDRIPDELADRSETVTSTGPPIPLWDRAWVMIVLSALLAAEWLARKHFHLA